VKRLAFLPIALATAAEAADYRGQPLENVLEELRAGGVQLLYSSDLVKPWMRVDRAPHSSEPHAMLAEILAPYGISVEDGPGGVLMLVRRPSRAPRQATPGTLRTPVPAPIDAVVVSASHYQFGDEPLPPTELDTGRLESLPDLGEDPVRAVARLPGVAGQDFSSRYHLRGGTEQETLFRFDDLRLYNPYHLKDFFGIFSSIDPAIVSDIRVYTGGFPVAFGDRSSGVVDIAPRLPGKGFQGEVVASLFTAGGSFGGATEDGSTDWALAARRGNLDLYLDLIDSPLGEPSYHDLYGRVGHRLNDWLAVSANALSLNDQVTAFDSDKEEVAIAEYRDQYYWLRADLGAPDGLGGRVLAAHTVLDSDRSGTENLPGVGAGALTDERRFVIDSLQADGWWRLGARSLLQAGAEWRQQQGRYDYTDVAAFDLLFLTPGAPAEPTRARDIRLRPSGEQAAAYVNWRFEPGAGIAADLGLRFDHETLSAADASQWSPRAVLMWQPQERTRLRFGWGRYYQAQAINELEVSDGETSYQRAQRATHLVASVEQDLAGALKLRAELYRKEYDHPFARHENLLNTAVVLPELKPDRILIEPDRALAEGVELSLRYDAAALSGWLTYTQAHVRDLVDGEWLRRSWDQRNYTSGGLIWRGSLWEASLAVVWHRGWPTTEVELAALEPQALVETGKRNAANLPDYARADLRVARRFDLGSAGELSAFIEVSNLTNQGNVCCVEYQLEDSETPETFLDVGPRNSLPLVPSLGVLWKF
jgi:outer membrane receptor protein involved in Fe transport